MATSDNIGALLKKKDAVTPDDLMNVFSEVAVKGLVRYIGNLEQGKADVTDVVDAHRLFSMLSEIQGFRNAVQGDGSGTLPEIRSAEQQVLMSSGIIEEGQEQDAKINLDGKSNEEMNQMIYALMEATNDENAGEM